MLTDMYGTWTIENKRGAENILINWVKIAKELNRSNVDRSNKWGKYLYLDESYVSW